MKGEQLSDEALMMQYQQGNQAAFETLYRKYKDMLYRYFINHISNTHQSEELYQEVWIKLINSAVRYEPKAKFKTFLFTIAHNTLVDYYRKNKASQIIEFENAEITQEPDVPGSLALPEDEFTLKQKTKQFIQTLEKLPVSQKEVALLYFEQDMSIEEIAEVTEVNPETAKSRLRYAKNKLKSAILN